MAWKYYILGFCMEILETCCFELPHPRVIHETLDNDTLIINLDSGYYYSLNPSGSFVWNLLLKQFALKDIATRIAGMLGVEIAIVSDDVAKFVSLLMEEELLSVSQQNAETISEDAIGEIRKCENYQAPSFSKYTDMEALLLADPIHEFVDE